MATKQLEFVIAFSYTDQVLTGFIFIRSYESKITRLFHFG